MNLTYHIREKKGNDWIGDRLPGTLFDTIAKAVDEEPNLLSVGARTLDMSYHDGLAVVVLDGDTLAGFTRLQFMHAGGGPGVPPWLELGSTLVRPEYRQNGINREMYRLLLPLHTDKNIFATTVNHASLAVGDEFGFVLVNRQELPAHIWQASCCCPLSKTRASNPNNVDCKLAHGEPQHEHLSQSCWFRVTPETAVRLREKKVAA